VKKLWLENPRGNEDPMVVEVDGAGREVEIGGEIYERADEFVWLEDEWVEIYQQVPDTAP
jgi:hypothetical protein